MESILGLLKSLKIQALAEWLQSLAVNAKAATVLGSIPASTDTVESEGRQMKQCTYVHTKRKNYFKLLSSSVVYFMEAETICRAYRHSVSVEIS